jgi:uracil-DNA glycosylase family 4
LRFIVGEQPGDKEDKMGKPFVGLADEILNEALNKADLTRLQPKGIVALGEALLEI